MKIFIFISIAALLSCNENGGSTSDKTTGDGGLKSDFSAAKYIYHDSLTVRQINTSSITPDELMDFAETQIGVPYVYASCDPKVGFDCSGFVTYVFNHFKIQVPRSSYGFTHMGKTVSFREAKRGDIILFRGTDSLSTDIGHIGMVVSNYNGVLNFIHATSGKAMAVTITTFDEHYKKRFVRICRIFKQNG